MLCKHLGIEHIEVAEDIASETFLQAMERWPYHGVPENPIAWLYTVAKNKARNHIHRNQIFNEKIVGHLTSSTSMDHEDSIDLSETNISDSQLQMLFAICHPVISPEAQIALALRILCGFGIEEIANAFLTNKETISKRLQRAKEKLRSEHIQIRVPSEAEIPARLDTVLTTLYLLFNEGYYSESNPEIVREDLCAEAMRLTLFLTEYPQTNLPAVNALLALMCFHASRLPARKSTDGQLILYHQQDEALWNVELISKGMQFLRAASQGDSLSKYHLEATIAYWHTIKEDSSEKWKSVLSLYDHLLNIESSPIVALNRTYAFAKVHGSRAAIAEAEKLDLRGNRFYHILLGELYLDIDREKSRQHFHNALELAPNAAEKQTIFARLYRD